MNSGEPESQQKRLTASREIACSIPRAVAAAVQWAERIMRRIDDVCATKQKGPLMTAPLVNSRTFFPQSKP
jgi:hypothetical protein